MFTQLEQAPTKPNTLRSSQEDQLNEPSCFSPEQQVAAARRAQMQQNLKETLQQVEFLNRMYPELCDLE
jgi:hypothetical protein